MEETLIDALMMLHAVLFITWTGIDVGVVILYPLILFSFLVLHPVYSFQVQARLVGLPFSSFEHQKSCTIVIHVFIEW